jgi:hypothetical protein
LQAFSRPCAAVQKLLLLTDAKASQNSSMRSHDIIWKYSPMPTP